jgi:hypothetical protein
VTKEVSDDKEARITGKVEKQTERKKKSTGMRRGEKMRKE